MPSYLTVGQGLTGTVTLPAAGGSFTMPVVNTALIQVGQILRVIHPAGAGAGTAGTFTFNVTTVDSAVQITSTYLNYLGDTGPGAAVGVGGQPIYLLYDPDYQFCNANAIIDLSECFNACSLTNVDQEAIMIYARVTALAAAGGTNYASNLTTLLTDSNSWRMMSEDKLGLLAVYETLMNGRVIGGSLSTNANELLASAATYRTMPTDTRKQVLAFLKCSINSRGLPA